jgi:hypothetical protein
MFDSDEEEDVPKRAAPTFTRSQLNQARTPAQTQTIIPPARQRFQTVPSSTPIVPIASQFFAVGPNGEAPAAYAPPTEPERRAMPYMPAGYMENLVSGGRPVVQAPPIADKSMHKPSTAVERGGYTRRSQPLSYTSNTVQKDANPITFETKRVHFTNPVTRMDIIAKWSFVLRR